MSADQCEMEPELALRYAQNAEELDALDPLWNALQEHHSEVMPALGGRTEPRQLADAWSRRRAKYARWLTDPDSFFVVAEKRSSPVGYAFVTIGPGYPAWATGRLAEMETLSVCRSIEGHESEADYSSPFGRDLPSLASMIWR
jgi:hypothetical protein